MAARPGDEIADEVLAKEVAAYTVSGLTPRAISEEMGVPIRRINAALRSDRFRITVEELQGPMLAKARVQLRTRIASIVKKVGDVLEKHLDDNNLQAIPHALKILGIQEQEESKGDTNLTVILPGQGQQEISIPHTIEAEATPCDSKPTE